MTPNEIDDTIRSTDAGRRLAERRPLTDDVIDVVMDMLMNHSLPPGPGSISTALRARWGSPPPRSVKPWPVSRPRV